MKFLDKRYKKVLFSFILLLILGSFIQTLVPYLAVISASTTSEDDDSLKIVTYNVLNGLDDYAIDMFDEIDADILALQEVYEICYKGSQINMSQLASILSYPYFSSPSNYNQRLYGLTILSNYEITNSSFIELSSPSETTPRGLIIADILKDNTSIRVITTHLDLPWYYSTRFNQVETLLKQINYDLPAIVLGDFNTPNSILDLTYWRLVTNLYDTWVASGNAPFTGKTWPVDFSYLRVDYIFVNDHCTTVRGSAELIRDEQISDHCGLSVKICV